MYRTFAVALFVCFSSVFADSTFITPEGSPKAGHSPTIQSNSYPSSQPIRPTGTIKITVYPPEALVYLNGKPIGKGSQIKELPLGEYEIFASFEDESKSQRVYVLGNQVRDVQLNLGRKTFVNVVSSFSQIWVNGLRAFGPGLQFEIQHQKSFYGINFNWDFFKDINYEEGADRASAVGGAAFTWHYQVLAYKDIISLAPGFVSGFWYFDGRDYMGNNSTDPYDYYYEDYDYIDSYMFGGPSLDFAIGYKVVSVNIGYSLLFGTELGHVLTTGMRIRL